MKTAVRVLCAGWRMDGQTDRYGAPSFLLSSWLVVLGVRLCCALGKGSWKVLWAGGTTMCPTQPSPWHEASLLNEQEFLLLADPADTLLRLRNLRDTWNHLGKIWGRSGWPWMLGPAFSRFIHSLPHSFFYTEV